MAQEEIMKWKVQQGHQGWFDLVMERPVTFKEFIQDVLSRKDNTGNIYIRLIGAKNAKEASMVYDYGAITWVSDDILNRVDECVIRQAQANGFPTKINYHLTLGIKGNVLV